MEHFYLQLKLSCALIFTKKYVIQLMGGSVEQFFMEIILVLGSLSLDYKFLLGAAIVEMASLKQSLKTPLIFSRFHDPPKLF